MARTCPHGRPTTPVPAEGREDGWLQDVAPGCPLCEGPINIPYKPGDPPGPPPLDASEMGQEEVVRRSRPMPADPPRRVCSVCKDPLKPGTVAVEDGAGGLRHVVGSPACRKIPSRPASSHEKAPPAPPERREPEERPVTPPEPETAPEPQEPPEPLPTCPTCGRPVVDGAPYDLAAIRRALTDALQAVDDLMAGEEREREALEELDGPA